jgi:hypothetical protein
MQKPASNCLAQQVHVAGAARRLGIKDGWRGVMDARLPAGLLGQLGERSLRTAGRGRLGDTLTQNRFAVMPALAADPIAPSQV